MKVKSSRNRKAKATNAKFLGEIIKEEQSVEIQRGMTFKAMETPGHSDGALSWLWDDQKIFLKKSIDSYVA